MPVTAYASPDQAGNITDMDMSKGRTYRYLQGEPVYPFGFGLSKQSTLTALSAGCHCERLVGSIYYGAYATEMVSLACHRAVIIALL